MAAWQKHSFWMSSFQTSWSTGSTTPSHHPSDSTKKHSLLNLGICKSTGTYLKYLGVVLTSDRWDSSLLLWFQTFCKTTEWIPALWQGAMGSNVSVRTWHVPRPCQRPAFQMRALCRYAESCGFFKKPLEFCQCGRETSPSSWTRAAG